MMFVVTNEKVVRCPLCDKEMLELDVVCNECLRKAREIRIARERIREGETSQSASWTSNKCGPYEIHYDGEFML